MTTRPRQIDQTAIASLATALVGIVAWPFLGGLAPLLAATLSLVFGFLALSRIKRNGHTGRWLAVAGIVLGAAFYVLLIVTIARDIIDPVKLQP